MTETTTRSRRSYSQLKLYLDCPAAYHRKYIERVPEEPSVWSPGGTAFHTCAEWYLAGDLGDAPEFHRVTDAWHAAWEIAVAEMLRRDPDLNPDPTTWRAAGRGREDVAWWARQGPLMVRDFVEWRATAGADLTTWDLGLAGNGLETRFEVELGGVPVVAIPDWLAIDEHGQLCIVDYKSGRRPQPPGHLQLGVYKAAVLAATGREAVWGMYYGTRTATVDLRNLSTWRLETIEQMFAAFEANVQAGRFNPRPGHKCINCGTTH